MIPSITQLGWARLSSTALPRSALVLAALATSACAAGAGEARLRFVRSWATEATWSFVVEDRALGAQLLVDGRFRQLGCNRAGQELRCELRGLFPGGHTVELRLPGAVLRRSVLVGRPWPARPLLVRVRDAAEAKAAAEAGADGVIAESDELLTIADIVDIAHKKGARALVAGPPELLETTAADGLLGAEIPTALRARFPEARAWFIDPAASQAAARLHAGADAAAAYRGVRAATGLIEAHDLVTAAVAMAAPRGAILDRAGFPLLGPRRRHAALRSGEPSLMLAEGPRLAFALRTRKDHVVVLLNGGKEAWASTVLLPEDPLDLLGGSTQPGQATIPPGDVALVIRSPQPDRSRM